VHPYVTVWPCVCHIFTFMKSLENLLWTRRTAGAALLNNIYTMISHCASVHSGPVKPSSFYFGVIFVINGVHLTGSVLCLIRGFCWWRYSANFVTIFLNWRALCNVDGDKVNYASICIAPTVWNSIPLSIRQSPSIGSFKRHIKTHLFTLPG